jgi:hypothetical protein
MASPVEEIIAERLADSPVEALPDGYRWTNPTGVTELTFSPVSPSDPSGPCAIAAVETRYLPDMPDFPRHALARLNRRSAFGNFYRTDEGLGSKLTFPIHDAESNAEWFTELLLTAMEGQSRLGSAIARSEVSDEALRANRAKLACPRSWEHRVTEEAKLEALAAEFREAGHFATALPHQLVLEVAMTEDTTLRMFDPAAQTALLHVTTDILHPLAGVGYLGTIALPFDPPAAEIADWCELLNAREHKEIDLAPRLGAWGARGAGDELVYGLFWPREQENASFHGYLVDGLIERVHWLSRNFWIPGAGLDLSSGQGNE